MVRYKKVDLENGYHDMVHSLTRRTVWMMLARMEQLKTRGALLVGSLVLRGHAVNSYGMGLACLYHMNKINTSYRTSFFANMLKQLYTYSQHNLKLLDTFTHDIFVIVDGWINGLHILESSGTTSNISWRWKFDESIGFNWYTKCNCTVTQKKEQNAFTHNSIF